jgi:hypothetical protein
MINLEIDDLKVIGANIACMIVLEIKTINIELQTLLFICTIIYTLIRTINEVQKFIREKNGKTNIDSADSDKEAKI